MFESGEGLDGLRGRAASCRRCDLYRDATQTVFGEGSVGARLLLVGEQPGDVEDRTGRPFVGPAGALLRRSLADAGISEDDTYITNAVKHFKYVVRGKRRIHQTPKVTEVRACVPWLEEEVALVKPAVVVALGATAARALFGSAFRLTERRGRIEPSRYAAATIATWHPSALLRLEDEGERAKATEAFVDDLSAAARAAGLEAMRG